MRAVDHYRAAVKGSTLSPVQKSVALAMADHMNYDTLGDAYPGPALIAGETGWEIRTVKRALKELVRLGWLVQVRKGGSTKHSPRLASVYQGSVPTTDGRTRPVTERHGSTRDSQTPVPVTHRHPTRDSHPATRVCQTLQPLS
jgi:hypothetical protein